MRAAATILFLIIIAMVYGALHELRLGGGFLTRLAITSILSFIAVLVHELGHAAAARRAGGTIHAIMVMPFELRLHPRRFGLSRGSGRDIGGYVAYSLKGGETRREAAAIAFAGPAANFALAIVVLLFTLWLAASGLRWTTIRSLTLLGHALAILSAGMGLANLIPFAGSDGEAIGRALFPQRRR